MSNWPFRKIYLYSVCLISLLFIMVNVFGAINNFVDAAFPVDYYTPSPLELQERLKAGQDGEVVSEEMIAAEEAFRKQRLGDMQRRNMALGLARLAGVLFVAFPIFWLHWRRTLPDD